MQDKEWSSEASRTGWQRGAWDGEPDRAQWKDRSTGIVCMAIRDPLLGYWKGAVGINSGHPWFGKGTLDDGRILGMAAHGGQVALVTKADERMKPDCDEGEPTDLWWFTFECSAALDGLPGDLVAGGRTYRDLPYVKQQCGLLAGQLDRLMKTGRTGA